LRIQCPDDQASSLFLLLDALLEASLGLKFSNSSFDDLDHHHPSHADLHLHHAPVSTFHFDLNDFLRIQKVVM
jgi:hypothetical protein